MHFSKKNIKLRSKCLKGFHNLVSSSQDLFSFLLFCFNVLTCFQFVTPSLQTGPVMTSGDDGAFLQPTLTAGSECDCCEDAFTGKGKHSEDYALRPLVPPS